METVQRLAPRLLVLDPLVRLHRLDENSSSEISGLLGYLRALQRGNDTSVVLVHHTSKRAHARHGQSLRGTSDLHAWADVGLYLTWHGDLLRLTTELRTARAPDAIDLDLVTEDPTTVHLEVRVADDAGNDDGAAPARPQPTLSQSILTLLEREIPHEMTRTALRQALRVNNAKLGSALTELEKMGLADRGERGWQLARH